MSKYIAQRGDICRWVEQDKGNCAKEYDGLQWSNPMALSDLILANLTMYLHIVRTNYEAEKYEIVHSIKKRQTKYYRMKVQDASNTAS